MAPSPSAIGLGFDEYKGCEREAWYTESVQLRTARLCLDCEEVHEGQQCPVCASESFAYISRWVPSPDRRTGSRPASTSPEVAVYRRLLVADAMRPKAMRLLKRGAVGLTVVSLARYIWRRRKDQRALADRSD